ncbi:MAG: hypothetical protein AAF216_03435 [Pseudomonadota bacterium]
MTSRRSPAQYAAAKVAAQALARAGLPLAEVARHVGVSLSAIRVWARKGGWRAGDLTKDTADTTTPAPLPLATAIKAAEAEAATAADTGDYAAASKAIAKTKQLKRLTRDLGALATPPGGEGRFEAALASGAVWNLSRDDWTGFTRAQAEACIMSAVLEKPLGEVWNSGSPDFGLGSGDPGVIK